ncbi:Tat pathway signal protein [Advenella sp. S44]|uniref:Bug family tripartite tricarboxylate transporter substrate binding protein n=1 Tax=Advenella sp. S44 TaxID=1982755 RepID=UPI000C2AACD4|nr:tripartite tricarboxylate transporter substrate binding protein [Advenella sp. S44]PJX22284.1 Tat pathway signal protein [Advenella sp. S44]
MKKPIGAFILLLAAAIFGPGTAGAQSFPSKPIRMIVPVPPGGSGDLVSRLVASAAAKHLQQPIVIDNRPGATGNIGTVAAINSPADGYTIFLCSIGNCSVNSSLYANPGFDLFKDIAPVILLGSSINAFVTGPNTDIDSVNTLIEKAKAGDISYGSSGVGASNHLAGELLKKMANIALLHVPYKGSGPAITDLIGGQIDVFFDNEPSILPFIQSGKVNALAVTGHSRTANLPDVPTMEELGYDGFVIEPWFAVGAPAGTPDAVIERLNTAFNEALKDPDVVSKLSQSGIRPIGGAASVLAGHIRTEHDRWAELIRTQGISTE